MEKQYKNFPFSIKQTNKKIAKDDDNPQASFNAKKLDLVDKTALILLIISGLDGVFGLFFHYSLVSKIVFFNAFLIRILTLLNGAAAVYFIIIFFKIRKQ